MPQTVPQNSITIRVPKQAFVIAGVGLILLLNVLYYSKLLNAFFTGADTLFQIDTSQIHSLTDIARIFTEPTMGYNLTIGGGIFFRPLISLEYGIYYAIWGASPFGYHLSNLFMHLVEVSLIFWLCRILFASNLVAGLGALFFSFHPVVLSSLTEPGGAGDIPMTAFFTLALIAFLLYGRSGRRGWQVLSLVSYLLALLSKETAMALWLVLFTTVLLTADDSRGWRRRLVAALGRIWPYAAMAAAFFIVRVLILHGLGGYPQPPMNTTEFLSLSWDHGRDYFRGLFSDHSLLSDPIPLQTGQLIYWLIWTIPAIAFLILWASQRFRIPQWRLAWIAVPATTAVLLTFTALTLPAETIAEGLTNVFLTLSLGAAVFLVARAVQVNRGIVKAIKKTRHIEAIAAISLWLYLPLAVALITRSFADYNMYLPSVALCLLLALLFSQGVKRAWAAGRGWAQSKQLDAVSVMIMLAGVAFIVVMFSVASVSQLSELKTANLDHEFFNRIAKLAASLPPGGTIEIDNFPRALFPFDGPEQELLQADDLQAWADISAPGKELHINIINYDDGTQQFEDLGMETVW